METAQRCLATYRKLRRLKSKANKVRNPSRTAIFWLEAPMFTAYRPT